MCSYRDGVFLILMQKRASLMMTAQWRAPHFNLSWVKAAAAGFVLIAAALSRNEAWMEKMVVADVLRDEEDSR